MAIVTDGFEAHVTLVDTGGDQATLTYDLVAANMADAATAMTAILSRLNAVTKATIKSYFVGERFVEDALVLPVGAQVEERATVSCSIDGEPLKRVTVNIPAPEDTLFGAPQTPAYNDVDIADAALSTYIGIWNSGGFATISDGELIAAGGILRGKRTHRQSSYG